MPFRFDYSVRKHSLKSERGLQDGKALYVFLIDAGLIDGILRSLKNLCFYITRLQKSYEILRVHCFGAHTKSHHVGFEDSILAQVGN